MLLYLQRQRNSCLIWNNPCCGWEQRMNWEQEIQDSLETGLAEEANPPIAEVGGGWPVIQYWADKTLSAQGPKIWQTLFHKSACLSCAWGTGGQKGGFVNEEGEVLQRCAKSVEAIASELQAGIPNDWFAEAEITDLQQLTSEQANQLGRLTYPMLLRAGQTRYQRISWAEAYEIATAAFRQPPQRVASYSSGRSSNEAAYLLQLMLRSLGSNNLADCSDLCHAPSTVGLAQMFGSGTSMVSLEGLKQADCVVLIGSNAPANHPRLMNELIKLRDRGSTIIIVNPMVEAGLVKFASPAFPIKSMLSGGSEISSLYLQPIPGSDVAVFVGIQKWLIETGNVQREFLQAHTEGWQAVLDHAQATSWESITQTCGLSHAEIAAGARLIAQADRVVFAWAMGATHHRNAVDNIFSIANTALLTGNVGKPGAGTMPIRGHSNVQGFGSMGVTTRLKEAIRTALETLLQRPLSKVMGYDTRALIDAADAGQVDALLCLGGNLYSANPNAAQAKRALGQIDTIIYLATKPNPGHFHGLAKTHTLVLPVLARFENPHRTTAESGNNFVRLNDAGSTHLTNADLVSEVEFLAELAYCLHGDTPVDWRRLQDTQYVRQLIAQTIPGYEAIGEIDRTETEFTVGNRIFETPQFATPSGKAKLFVTPLPDLQLPTAADFGITQNRHLVLALGTGRSYSQHNTVVYKPGDRYRNMPHRNCILLNGPEAQAAGFAEGDRVTVRGDAGQLERVEIVYGGIRQGAAFMFYPETNAIFTAQVDPRCGTPGFKRVPIVLFDPAR
jgi:molybdopterin-dependent oxidoreductase alpha subunit